MSNICNIGEFSPFGMAVQQLLAMSGGGESNMNNDVKNIIMTLFKKVVIGEKSDYKIDLTIKESNVRRLGGAEILLAESLKNNVLSFNTLLELVTLRDRGVIEELSKHAVSVKVTDNALRSSIKHLYKTPIPSDSAKLHTFLGFHSPV